MSSLETEIKKLDGPILVLGASGFIGSNLFNLIIRSRSDVYAVIRGKKNWRLSNVDDCNIIYADMTNQDEVIAVINTLLPRTIFDFMAYGAYSFEKNIEKIYTTNFLAAINVIEALSHLSITAYVHAGTSSEYGLNCSGPKEDSYKIPNSHYAVSKAAISEYIKFAGIVRKIPCINLCLYSVYGPLEDSSRLIPNLLLNALENKLPDFVDGSISRDFIYVDDVCEIFIRSATNLSPIIYGNSFNIGSGNATTIAELAQLTSLLFDIKDMPKFGTMEGRHWDLKNWFSNPMKVSKTFDWHPRVTLADGLLKTAKWIATINKDEFYKLTKDCNFN